MDPYAAAKLKNSGTLFDTHPATSRAQRGKRRGDCLDLEEQPFGTHTVTDKVNHHIDGGGDCAPFTVQSKRHCAGLFNPECNSSATTTFENGHPHHSHSTPLSNGHHQMQYQEQNQGQFDAEMDTCELPSETSDHIGFHNHCGDNHYDKCFAQNGISIKPTAPVMMNGYYGFIMKYDHAGSDQVQNDSMEAQEAQAEYAINGPDRCIFPSERRVCARCSAGEPGHITHIIGQ